MNSSKDKYFETVCINCPGSLWGEKSICRIHNKSIGELVSCKQWGRYETNFPQYRIDDDQIAFLTLEPAIEIVQKTEEDLRSYHWMIKEIDRLSTQLDNSLKNYGLNSRLVAQYGIDAAMPKAQGMKLSTLSISEERYEKQLVRLSKLEEKVKKVNDATEKFKEGIEKTVLECILDGERMNNIASHIGVSRQRLNEIKRKIVKNMAWTLYEEELRDNHYGKCSL